LPPGSIVQRPSVVFPRKNEATECHRDERRLQLPFPLVLVDATADAGSARVVRRRERARVLRNRDMARFPFLGAGRTGPGWPVSVGIPQQKMCLLKGNRA